MAEGSPALLATSENGAAPVVSPSAVQIEYLLGALEKVFSGEQEFEDAFEQLNTHTARVRRNFPHLYQVLRNPPGMQNSVLAALDSGSLHDVSETLAQLLDAKFTPLVPEIVASVVAAMPKPQIVQMAQQPMLQPMMVQPQQRVEDGFGGSTMESSIQQPGAVENTPGGLRIYDYQPWSQQLAPTSALKQKWAIRWDSEAPMRPVGETSTIKSPGGRLRFAVVDQLDERTQVWELVKILPYERG